MIQWLGVPLGIIGTTYYGGVFKYGWGNIIKLLAKIIAAKKEEEQEKQERDRSKEKERKQQEELNRQREDDRKREPDYDYHPAIDGGL